jgi:hypothetical protein
LISQFELFHGMKQNGFALKEQKLFGYRTFHALTHSSRDKYGDFFQSDVLK